MPLQLPKVVLAQLPTEQFFSFSRVRSPRSDSSASRTCFGTWRAVHVHLASVLSLSTSASARQFSVALAHLSASSWNLLGDLKAAGSRPPLLWEGSHYPYSLALILSVSMEASSQVLYPF